MAGDRSGDIVLAGSGGQQASMTLSTLFDQTHRSTSLVLAIDSLIIVLIAWDIAGVSQQYLGRLSMLIWAIPLFATTSSKAFISASTSDSFASNPKGRTKPQTKTIA